MSDPIDFRAGPAAPPAALHGERRAVLALLAVCLLAWSGAVARGGFAFDDREAIEGNPLVEGAAPWTAAFARDYWHHRGDAGHHRPLATLSLRLDRALWGGRAWGYHLTNVLLHAGVVALAAAALLRLRRAGLGARATSPLGLLPFAAHPVLADSVAWISGRTSMLAGLGGAGALLAAAAAPPLAGGALAGAAVLAGTLGKEDACVFVPAAVLVGAVRSRRHAAAQAAGGALALVAAGALRRAALGEWIPSAPSAPLGGLDLAARLPYAGRALLEAARLVVWPFAGPPSYRGVPGFTPAEPPAAWAALGWLLWIAPVALGAAALARGRARRAPGRVGLALAALALLPVLQLVPAGEVFAPRFLYAPLLLAAPAFAPALARLPRPGIAALALALVAGAWVQAGRYGSRAAYARATLAHAPGDARSWNDLGLALEEDGRLADAVEAYGRATAEDPGYGRPWSNLGRLALERGAVDEAVRLLERAVARAPRQPVARLNLGSALRRAGDPEGALRAYRRAAELAPGLGPAWRGVGLAALDLGREDEARAALERALALDPGDRDARALLERLR